jgi:hypothetical protein
MITTSTNTKNGSAHKPLIYLLQNEQDDDAIKLREQCGNHHNNAWVCRRHGSIDLKHDVATGTTRYLKGEIQVQGFVFEGHANWELSNAGATCCGGGTGYEGRLRLGSVEEAIRFLKKYYHVVACKENTKETQDWIDAL